MTTHKWKDIEHKRDQRIANLIAQAREFVEHSGGSWSGDALLLALADALEAAVEQTLRWQNAYDRERAKNEATEVENRRLREALKEIERRSLTYGHSAIARAALDGSGE